MVHNRQMEQQTKIEMVRKSDTELAALLENLINGPINRKTFSRITYVYAIFMLFLYMCEPNLTNIYHNDTFVLQKHKSILTLQRPGFFEGQKVGGLYRPTTCHFFIFSTNQMKNGRNIHHHVNFHFLSKKNFDCPKFC